MGLARDLVQDLFYGVRLLGRRHTSSAVAILALGLGIGANSAIFSVVDAILLQPLPYDDPERLIAVRESIPEVTDVLPLTELEYFELSRRVRSMQAVALAGQAQLTLLEGEEPAIHDGMRVTGSFFSVLGVRPLLGRVLEPADAEPGADPVVVLDYGLWRRRFGGERSILGRPIRMKVSTLLGAGSELATQYTVVGVLPPDFRSPFEEEEIWLPRVLTEASANRRFHGDFLIGRLAPGATVEQARGEVASVLETVEPEHPIHQRPGREVTVLPLPELLVRNVRAGLLILWAAVGLVLLIACANVANLQLAQALARQQEMALRVSIGAGRGRLVRQLLTESMILALLGGAAGLLIAWGVLRALIAFNSGDIPRLDEVALEPRVLLFTLAVSVAAGLFFGLFPAWRASRPDLHDSLKSGKRAGAGRGHERLRGALVVAEVGLSLLVLIGAGLLLRSFHDLQRSDYGFEPGGVLTMDIALAQSRYPETFQQEAFFRDLLGRIRGLPQTGEVGLVNTLPMSRFNTATAFDIEGRVRAEGEVFTANFRLATPGFFDVLEVPVLEGRGLEESDLRSPPFVVVVDRTFARTYWPDRGAVGERLVLGGVEHPVTVVGVVGDVQHQAMSEEARPTFYLPWLNSPAMSVVVETEAEDPTVLAGELRRLVLARDPEQPVTISTLDEAVSGAIARPRFNAVMLGLLAGVALLLSILGIYAVMSYTVRQRHHEIGIRMALGASNGSVVRQILRRGLGLTVLGTVLGVAAALASTRWIESQLFGVSPTDPSTYLTTTALLVAVALLANLLPARRATRVEPVRVLQEE